MVIIKGQFNGPATTGNGGYVSGLLAQHLDLSNPADPVQVRLLQPPPLDTPLSFERDNIELRLITSGGAIVARAEVGTFLNEPPRFADADVVARGQAAYKGFDLHPFDSCFACGTARDVGDGLRVFSGPIGDDRVAGFWEADEAFAHQDGAIDVPVIWAAMDCPGGWAADQSVEPMLLGTMTGSVLRPPLAGETYHAVGEVTARDGRKVFTSTGLYSADGDLLARSEQVWIAIGR